MEVDQIIMLAQAILPALAVFAAVYFTMKQIFSQQEGKVEADLRMQAVKHALPLRYQAYERLLILMDRITPNNLILRVQSSEMTARQLHLSLLDAIRDESEHNITQQLYVSDETWSAVIQARDNTIRLINEASDGLQESDGAIELSRRVFNLVMEQKVLPTMAASHVIKEEARKYM